MPLPPMSAAVEIWFGAAFFQLHPMLMQVHQAGAQLSGEVKLEFGSGLAGLLGKFLAWRLGIPSRAESVAMTVTIYSTTEALHWHRRFGQSAEFISVFHPFGHYPDGYWLESSGWLRLRLGVRIVNGGWVWQAQGAQLWGIPIPAWLLPRTLAAKYIEDGTYRFHVRVAVPLLGNLLCYAGKLVATPLAASKSASARN